MEDVAPLIRATARVRNDETLCYRGEEGAAGPSPRCLDGSGPSPSTTAFDLQALRAKGRQAQTVSLQRPPMICPRCQSEMVPIMYGFPGNLTTAVEAEARGYLKVGGCVITPESPAWWCSECDEGEGVVADLPDDSTGVVGRAWEETWPSR